MNNKRTPIAIGVILIIGLTALFLWPKLTNPHRKSIAQLNESGIECLNGHSQANQHFHPHLRIIVDGLEEAIPANVGIYSGCMAEIHTHDVSGTLHVESVSTSKIFHLKDFFVVYEKSIEREGYEVFMTVNGQPSNAFGELVLEDRQQIVLEYKTK